MLATLAVSLIPLLLAGAVPMPSESQVLLVTRERPERSSIPDCLASLGTYGSVSGSEHIYLGTEKCLQNNIDSLTGGIEAGSLIPLEAARSEEKRLFWLGEAGVEGKIHVAGLSAPLDGVYESIQDKADMLAAMSNLELASNQKVLGGDHHQAMVNAQVERLYQTGQSLIFSASSGLIPLLDTLIPSYLSLVALPSIDAALSMSGEGVRKDLAQNLANLTKHIRFSSEIDKILTEGMDERQLVRDIRWLTGESSNIESRHSFTGGARDAARWIKEKVQATGAECNLEPFLPGFAPNIICTYPSLIANATDLTIMSAHYDSRGSFGKLRAPGGDDDGSGTGHLLGIAQAIAKQNVRFQKPVVLAFFAGEEQGLLGSHAYAKRLASENATVLLQVQADMLGYRVASEPRQLGLPASIETPEASWLIGNLSQIYSPELVVGRTAACCSDHQSFLSYNFPATQVFERNDWIADPEYHSSGDVSMRDNYDFDQISAISRVVFAALLTVAGYQL